MEPMRTKRCEPTRLAQVTQRRQIGFCSAALLLLTAVGCEPPAAAVKPADRVVEAFTGTQPAQYAPKLQGPPAAANIQTPTATVLPAPGMVREAASASLTKQGAKGTNVDPILTPVSTYFTVKDQVVFQYQIPKAMEIYSGLQNRKPKDFAEFEREIVQKNGIQLPELPPTHRYFYDPDQGALLVEHPGN